MEKQRIIAWKTTDRDGVITHTGIEKDKCMIDQEWLKENNLTLHQKEFLIYFDCFGSGDIEIANVKHCRNCGSEVEYSGSGIYICISCKPDLPNHTREEIDKKTGGLRKALEEIRIAREVMTEDCNCRNDEKILTCPVDCICNCHKSNEELLRLYRIIQRKKYQ